MNIYYQIILSALIAFVDSSIKNPNSPSAQALKDKLIQLANGLNTLIASRWPNG